MGNFSHKDDEWASYREDFSEIIKGELYLSSVACAKREFVGKSGVRGVISVTQKPVEALEGFKRVLHLKVDDIPSESIATHFSEAHDFITGNKPVLVHCMAGVSRSATVVISYIMKTQKMTALNAFKFVKKRRKQISPNCGFFDQLLDYQREIKIDSPDRKERELALYLSNQRIGLIGKMGMTVEMLEEGLIKEGNVMDAQLYALRLADEKEKEKKGAEIKGAEIKGAGKMGTIKMGENIEKEDMREEENVEEENVKEEMKCEKEDMVEENVEDESVEKENVEEEKVEEEKEGK